MPSLAENRAAWDGEYHWQRDGDDWSGPWGTVAMQWYGSILPRIHRHVPTGTILEIATGYGRWTTFLLDRCHHLIGIDISERAITACKHRFGSRGEYHVTDGTTLPAEDGSVDFVFSFDSLVHAEADVMESYISEIARVLRPGGAAFLHHSNLGDFGVYLAFIGKIRYGRDRLINWGWIDPIDVHWRAKSVGAVSVASMAGDAGLSVVGQECIPWRNTRRPIDCLTTLTADAQTRTPPIRNTDFGREVAAWQRLSGIYG